VTNLDVHAAAIAAGDERAFARWLAGSEAPIRASLRSFAASVDTEAVLQETLLRVWQVAPRFEADGRDNGLLRLAIRIARNLAISETRRLRTRPIEPDDLERHLAEAMGPAGTSDPLLARLIAKCREKLPTKPAQALAARLESFGAASDAVLAERLGMQKNTFLQNFTRARRMLEQCLERGGVDIREAST
jgi:DNA-directed RNA polymerase specialized sigma24 family protein